VCRRDFEIDYVSVSFCNSVDDLYSMRHLLDSLSMQQTKIIAKVGRYQPIACLVATPPIGGVSREQLPRWQAATRCSWGGTQPSLCRRELGTVSGRSGRSGGSNAEGGKEGQGDGLDDGLDCCCRGGACYPPSSTICSCRSCWCCWPHGCERCIKAGGNAPKEQ
jgi:hypothetical protein